MTILQTKAAKKIKGKDRITLGLNYKQRGRDGIWPKHRKSAADDGRRSRQRFQGEKEETTTTQGPDGHRSGGIQMSQEKEGLVSLCWHIL